MPPHVQHPPEMVVGLIAGGPPGADPVDRGRRGRPRPGCRRPRRPGRRRPRPGRGDRDLRADAVRAGGGPRGQTSRARRPSAWPATGRACWARGRPRDRPAGRPRGDRGVDPVEGRHGHENGPEHDHDRGHGPDRQDAGEPDGRLHAGQREAADPGAADAPRAGRASTTTGPSSCCRPAAAGSRSPWSRPWPGSGPTRPMRCSAHGGRVRQAVAAQQRRATQI